MSTRKQKIALLQKARTRVERGHSYYICTALQKVAKYSVEGEMLASRELRVYIQKALGRGCDDLDLWLYKRYGSQPEGMGRAARLDWIDWMIACYKEDIANGLK